MLTTHNLAIMREAARAAALRSAGLQQVSVGGAGGPHLVSDVSRLGFSGRLYRRAAQAWNVVVAPFPDMLWPSNLWGLGRVTTAKEDRT
jgi:hypothetical protein